MIRLAARRWVDGNRLDALTSDYFTHAEQRTLDIYVRRSKPDFLILSTTGDDEYFHSLAFEQWEGHRHFAVILPENVAWRCDWGWAPAQPTVLHGPIDKETSPWLRRSCRAEGAASAAPSLPFRRTDYLYLITTTNDLGKLMMH